MRKVFFALILGSFVVNFAFANEDRQVYAKECLSIIEKPKFEVTSSYGKLVYNFDKDEKFLLQEMKKKYEANQLEMPDDFSPVGLSKVREALNLELEVGQIEVSHGYSCLYPQNIKAHLGYYVPTIYILSNLDKESCLYKLSLKHEQTHMQIYIEALDFFLPEFKKTVLESFDKIGVMIIDREESASFKAEELSKKYKDMVSKKVDKWRKEVEKEQLKLDSPEHYMLETKLCETESVEE